MSRPGRPPAAIEVECRIDSQRLERNDTIVEVLLELPHQIIDEVWGVRNIQRRGASLHSQWQGLGRIGSLAGHLSRFNHLLEHEVAAFQSTLLTRTWRVVVRAPDNARQKRRSASVRFDTSLSKYDRAA